MASFWRKLTPDEYQHCIYDIDLDALRARGIVGLIIDLDNTLAAWRFGQPEPRLAEWVRSAKDRGLVPFIVSNDLGPRVELFTRYLGIPGMARAGKPRSGAFRRATARLGLSPDKVVVVGDQLFTDVLGAKPLGCRTILVTPLSDREFPGTRLVRLVERFVLRVLTARGFLESPVHRRPQGRFPRLDLEEPGGSERPG